MSSHERNQLLKDISARAARDISFRRQLLSKPSEAIQETFGVQVPADFRVRFIERPAGVDQIIVLPEFNAGYEELDDDDLEAAAGGGDPGDPMW